LSNDSFSNDSFPKDSFPNDIGLVSQDTAAVGSKREAVLARPGNRRLGKTLSQIDPTMGSLPANLFSSPIMEVEPTRLTKPTESSMTTEGNGYTINHPEVAPAEQAEEAHAIQSAVAVFWDRDNTLIHDPGYLNDPDQVELLPGASRALSRLARAGFQNIIITNQSAIARGLLTEVGLEAIHQRLCALLAAENARLDAIYYCPYLEGAEAVVEKYRMASNLRKPNPGMLAQASLERQIDLTTSWMVGNSLSDTQAGRAAGCKTILVPRGEAVQRDHSVDFVASSLDEAAEIILKHAKLQAKGEAEVVAGKVEVITKAESVMESRPSAHGAGNSQATSNAICSPRTTATVTSTSATASASTSAGSHDLAVANKLQDILSFLKTADQKDREEKFQLSQMLGIVTQMLAAAVLVWAMVSMAHSEVANSTLIVRFLFALVLQVLALTCYVISGRK